MANLANLSAGMAVTVRVGSTVRPALVKSIDAGKVHVAFADVPADWASIPASRRGGLFGASVRPAAITITKGV